MREFFVAVVNNSGLTLHIRQLHGRNDHHIVEACFKAFARALRMATEVDPRRSGQVPSSKGVLEQAGGVEVGCILFRYVNNNRLRPNVETIAAMQAARSGEVQSFASINALLDDLDAAD